METINQELTSEGLHIPSEQLEPLGWKPGQNVQIAVTPDAIRVTRPPNLAQLVIKRAHRHLMCHIGDATAAGPVESYGEGWRVPVYLSYRDVYLGELLFDQEGQLMPDRSSSREEMLARAHAD